MEIGDSKCAEPRFRIPPLWKQRPLRAGRGRNAVCAVSQRGKGQLRIKYLPTRRTAVYPHRNLGGIAGTIHFKEVEVKDIAHLPTDEKNEFLADMHYINPLKALMMAKAINVLPKQVLFLGCESEEHEEIGIGVSIAVEAAMPIAFKKVTQWIENILQQQMRCID